MARTRTRKATENSSTEKNNSVSEFAEENAVSARKDRPTPSTRQAKPPSNGLISRIPVVRSIAAYLRGVASEMQKVTWPSREEATRLTGVVLGVTAAFAIALGLLDTFFTWWFSQAFDPDTEIIFLGIAIVVAVLVSGSYITLRNRI